MIDTTFTLANDDLLVLAFRTADQPCFESAQLPVALPACLAPRKAGAAETAFVGLVGRRRVIVRTVRLDGDNGSAALQLKRAVAAALAEAETRACRRVIVPLAGACAGEFAVPVQEAALLGGYAFDRYLKARKAPVAVCIVTPRAPADLRGALERSRRVCACVNAARDLANEPPNVCKPASLVRELRAHGRRAGLAVTLWDEARLRRERCGGIVSVGQGSPSRPCLAIGRYAPAGARKHLCLVGKGVTFDSGGYCVKNADNQKGMKYDMTGAAVMWLAACAIAQLRLPIRVTVFAPLVENLISGEAYLMDAVLRMRNGTTVEIMNTDAEGRLILADALVLAGEQKPDWIVDAATLTGACMVALGQDIAGVLGTDAALTGQVIRAGALEDERFSELPLYAPYAEELKSTIADCKNGGGRYAGAIMGALFLKQFVPGAIPWAHLDIAGPGNKEEPLDHLGKGSKGFGVKTVVRLAEQLAGGKAGRG